MRKLFIICLSLILISTVSDLKAQRLIKNSFVTGVSYAGNKVNRIYIPPPKEYFEKSRQKGGASMTVSFINCPEKVVIPVKYAVSILEKILPRDVRISVAVTWKKISGSGILANSSTGFYVAGWSVDAFNPDVFYPVALAEKIAGEALNRNADGDIILNINSSVSWFYGTDGKTPPFNYDLVTVALHEMCHGLGFFDTFRTEGANGLYGTAKIPVIYDTFVENQAGGRLTDTIAYPNPSPALKTALTSGQVWFNGPLIKTYSPVSRPRLWAPSTFDVGSSIAHLDPSSTLAANSLMTPYIDLGEAIHDPGKYTMSILGDLGWVNTRVIHETPKDTEEHLSEIKISATIKSDTTYNHNKVGLVWSYNNFITSDTTFMTSPGSNNSYTATIAVTSYETRLDYYLYAEDRFLRLFRSPSYIKKLKHQVFIGTDTVKPLLVHSPEKFYFEKIDSIKFEVLAVDNLGLDKVYIEYKINNGLQEYLGLVSKGNDEYGNYLNPKALSLKGGDSLQYRIVAVDKAAAANLKVLPATGYFSVKIESVKAVADGYTTDFSDAGNDFVNDGFRILKPAGFSSSGLNTPHPYVSPGESGDSIGYTAALRIPIKFDADGMIISYRELVLAEPGEDGSLFGTTDFYDYVIVEGSRNFGKSWFKLADGYDSRYKTSWETAYNSSINGDNSTFIGTESMLMKHTIFPKVSRDIAAGDTLMVRFRLFSDPLANGWGWVIEDLHIGALIDQVEEISYTPLIIYPNPGNGRISFRMADGEFIRPVGFSVFNSAGICVMKGTTGGGEESKINISKYPSGLYFIVFHLDSGLRTVKYTLIR